MSARIFFLLPKLPWWRFLCKEKIDLVSTITLLAERKEWLDRLISAGEHFRCTWLIEDFLESCFETRCNASRQLKLLFLLWRTRFEKLLALFSVTWKIYSTSVIDPRHEPLDQFNQHFLQQASFWLLALLWWQCSMSVSAWAGKKSNKNLYNCKTAAVTKFFDLFDSSNGEESLYPDNLDPKYIISCFQANNTPKPLKRFLLWMRGGKKQHCIKMKAINSFKRAWSDWFV